MSIKDWFSKNKEEGFDMDSLDNELKEDSGLKLDELNDDTDSFGNKKVPFKPSSLDSAHTNYKDDNESQPNNSSNTNMNELILSKLDTIKAELNNVNHRLEKIENKKKDKLW